MSGCHDEHKKAHPSPTCLVTNPIRQDVELSKGYVAQIHAIQHIELRALERGYLQGISVDEGQSVKKGTLMFQIMPMLYQAEVQKAAADTQLTELEYKNTKILADQDIVSTNELALAQAKFSRAKAELSLATTHNALTSVRAPFDGMMGRFEVRLGSLVEEGSLLTTLADNSTVWVYFNVSEAEYLDYKSDKLRSGSHGAPQEVKLLMANGKRFEHVGRVETIEADFNRSADTLRKKYPRTRFLATTDVDAVARADLIFTATSDPDPVIYAHHVKPGAWIYDLGRPVDVDESVLTVPGVELVPGGVVRPPGSMPSRIDLRFGDGNVPACLAEKMILTATGAFERRSIGNGTRSNDIEFYLLEGERLGFEIVTRDARLLDERVIA